MEGGRNMAVVGLLIALVLVGSSGGGATSWQDAKSDIAMVTDLDSKYEGLTDQYFITECLGTGHLVAEFARFVVDYGKVYKSLSELRHRFNTFVSNVELIESTNKQDLSYKLGINRFADLSFEEFEQSWLGAKQECSATKFTHKMRGVELPLSVDWRLHNIVSPVKDQASCGSCWTFSTTGALEAAHAQATGHMVLLSEQQLVDCAGDFNNFGCKGGLPSQAFEYIRYNGGLDTEDSYPYKAKNYECTFNPETIGAKVYDVVNITKNDEAELKDAVAFNRPVSIAFEVVTGFSLYKSGVYTSTKCRDKAETVNHAVLAVGYGTTDDGLPYWIIKNSWGSSWGDHGYFKMEMGKNMCGVAVCASYPLVPEDLLR